MKIAIVGLGKMGKQIAKKLHEGGNTVIVHNRSKGSVDELSALGMKPAYTREEVVSAFDNEQIIIWLMIPSETVDQELSEWLKIVPKKSILIDGGNSDFRLTKKRAELVLGNGSILMDVGTSGGVWGYDNGFSMMAGGDTETFKKIEPSTVEIKAPQSS